MATKNEAAKMLGVACLVLVLTSASALAYLDLANARKNDRGYSKILVFVREVDWAISSLFRGEKTSLPSNL